MNQTPSPLRCVALWLILAMTLPLPSGAQAPAEPPGPPAIPPARTNLTDGEVRKVDLAAKKLTIRHGPIRNLDMPAMTMVFQVRDGALLENRKPGDRIRFAVEMSASGYVVTEIRNAP